MHPITIIEISVSIGFIVIIIVLAQLPKKYRKVSLIIGSLLSAMLLLYFVIRPFWIDYQVSKKTEHLSLYLKEKYPDQEWKVSQKEGRQYNPYHFEVNFENEKGWTYTYSVEDDDTICQNGWTPPENTIPREGEHFELQHCE